MTITVEGLGPVLDLGIAIGLIDDQEQFNDDWFSDPGAYVSAMLRTPHQREALLRAADQLLAQNTGVLIDGRGRHWTPIIQDGGVALYLVVSEDGPVTELGIGAAAQTDQPAEANVSAYAPLFRIPISGDIIVPFLDGSGAVAIEADVSLDGVTPAPGEAALAGFRFAASVMTDGSSPLLSITLRGLQLPGQSAPSDVSLEGDLGSLNDQALQLVLGLIQQSAASAAGELAELLALIGITGDARVPPLPVAEILEEGPGAWAGWLETLLADSAAVTAWLDHLAQLVGHSAVVASAAVEGLPHRVEWTLASGIQLASVVLVTRSANGERTVELGMEGALENSAPPRGSLEFATTLTRIILGSPVRVEGLPHLSVFGRVGCREILSPADLLVNEPDPTPQVGSLLLGFTMGVDRQAGLILAAQDMTILGQPYPLLDLTNPQTLADVGTAALDNLGADILNRLGPAAADLRVLMGIDAPPGQAAWATPLTGLSDLLANPPGAILAYHRRVLDTDRANYPAVLDSLRKLLVSAGLNVPITGNGTKESPWRIEIADGVAVVTWLEGDRLELGLVVDRRVVDLGGGCPDVTLLLLARLVSLGLDGSGSQALPGVSTQLLLQARGGVPLRIGDSSAAIQVDRVGVTFDWTLAAGLATVLVTPGLEAEIDGETVPFSLPTLAADGTLDGEIPWRALELLSAHLLVRLDQPWAVELVRLLGWLPGRIAAANRLPMQSLYTDPAGALTAWAADTARAELLPEVARALSLVINGPAAPGLLSGAYRGRGDAVSPLVVPLGGAGSASAPVRVELLLWTDKTPRVPEIAIPVDATLAQIAAAIQQAAGVRADAADLLADRGDLAGGLATLAARWADTDGMVRAADALLPGALIHNLDGVTHTELPLVDLAGLTGVTLDAGALVVVTPGETPSWPGIDEDHILDLSAPGLSPEAFDLSRAAAEDGPWLVRLPSRLDAAVNPGDDGAALQAARLARLVEVVAAHADGNYPVALIGYGAGGHAAAAVAATATAVAQLVMVGTPHGGLSLDVLEAQPVAGALQLLQSLLPEANPDLTESEALRCARRLLAPLMAAYDAAITPLTDLVPPIPTPVIPANVEVHCVCGRVNMEQVRQALVALVAGGLNVPAAEAAAAAINGEAINWGLNVTVDPPAAPGEIHLVLELALTGRLLAGASRPGLRARLSVGRVGGWLSGGPDLTRPAGVARHPSLRRAVLEVDLPDGGPAAACAIFHEASALGVSNRRWEVGPSGAADPLLPEAQVLFGRLAAALGPVPASGTLRQVVDLLAALGLTEPAAPVTGGTLGFSLEGVRRLLVDPAGLFGELTAPARAHPIAAALAAVLGASAPAAGSTSLQFARDGFTFSADLAARTLRAEAVDLALAAGAGLSALVELTGQQKFAGQLGLALGPVGGPNGRPVLEVSFAPVSGQVRWEGGGDFLPGPVVLYPSFDQPGLARLITDLVPAQILWAGITFLRSLQPGAVALVDPLLRIVGLLDGEDATARVVLPLALLKDPGHWLTHTAAMGDGAGGPNAEKLQDLLDVAAAMFGIPQPQVGAWTLPYGLVLAGGQSAGRAALTLRLDQPLADTGLRLAGSFGLLMGSGLPPAPLIEALLALPGAAPIDTSGRVTLSVGAGGLAARLIVPSSGIDLALLPNGPGLAALGSAVAAAAVTYALPLVLDAIAGLPAVHPAGPVGAALADLGDLLGLRSGGNFSGPEIISLAADPASQLGQRLAANRQAAFDAVASLLSPALPGGGGYSLARSGDELVFTFAGSGANPLTLDLRLSVPGGGTPEGVRVSGSVNGLHPFDGASLGGRLVIEPSGLAEASAAFAVAHADALDLGPISLAPMAEIAIGSAPVGGARIAAGLAVDPTNSVRGVLRLGATPTFTLEPGGSLSLEEALIRLLLPPLVDLALDTTQVQDLLDKPVLGGVTVRDLLDGVVFTGNAFDPGLLDTTTLWDRALILAANVAELTPALPLDPLEVKISRRDLAANDRVYGISISLPPGSRFDLVDGDVVVMAEVDSSWVSGPAGADGLLIELLRLNGGTPSPFFGFSVRGLGLRLGKAAGPLVDTGLVIESVAMHGLFSVDGTGSVTEAGGQIELGGLNLALGGADSGTNPVASGVLRDAASGGETPKAAFSPALAVQSQNGGAPTFNLRAGEGNGPWWIGIQRGFGPVYIEQIGFGVGKDGERVVSVSVLIDGKVSLLSLILAVEGLSLGVKWPQDADDAPLYSPSAWEVDLAGLGVSASTGGVILTGGLSRSPGELPDYVGMISLRFSVYGISAFGGYAVVSDDQGQYTSLFIYGALVAPLGGPPAFFVTGIGAGVGVNRLLLLPDDLSLFPTYPLLMALDRNSPMADPDEALDQLRAYFPVDRGTFWFAAGLSFNSFSLIDGIAVVGVVIGDGLEINLLGLARAGLPNPSAPLVQIELALVARFSSEEGVLWVQAQLTDNSFLLTRDCRLTGGFAFVMWFTGDKAGEFVVTLGGFHPSFHRDGYPQVPRLGFVWSVSDALVIKGESYFALTSEAIMAGTRFEASLTLGPLWAYLRLGADGIVYFDPFKFEVTAFAELGAGITIDVDLGFFGHVRITIEVNLHADVILEGPEFHGSATIDLDVTSATIAFGSTADRSTPVLGWADFEGKYLRPNDAAMLTVTPGRGMLPPNSEDSNKAPTGGQNDPFLLLPEFDLTITSTGAISGFSANGPVKNVPQTFLAIAPMQVASVTSILTVSVRAQDGTEYVQTLNPTATIGRFPAGVWKSLPQSDPKPIPSAEMVEAANGVTLTGEANISVGTVEIDYYQVEIGPRLPLPFLAEREARFERVQDVIAAENMVQIAPADPALVLAEARARLEAGPQGSSFSPLASASYATTRAAPPQLVPLTYGMAIDPGAPVDVPAAPPKPVRETPDTRSYPLRVDALLTEAPRVKTKGAYAMHREVTGIRAAASARGVTTLGDAGNDLPRVNPPRMADVKATLDTRMAARLVQVPPSARVTDTAVIPIGCLPFTGRAGAGGELRRQVGQPRAAARRLQGLTKALSGEGIDLLSGEAALLTAQNSSQDVRSERPGLLVQGDLHVRLVAFDPAGGVILDATTAGGRVAIPERTERVLVLAGAGGQENHPAGGMPGWHAGSQLVQVGAQALVGPGCVLITGARLSTRRRLGGVSTGFVTAHEVVRGYSNVTTCLPSGLTALAVVLESAPRQDDQRGDALDLGLTGARRALGSDGRALPPVIIADGSQVIQVYSIWPDEKAGAIEVIVAAGEHRNLSGVIGSRSSAGTFAEALRRDLAGSIARLVSPAPGMTRLRWLPAGPARQPRSKRS